MNKLESDDNLSFSNNFSFSSQFSSGIGYCHYEQQIDLSNSLFVEDKQKTTFILKIKRIIAKWKKWLTNYYCQQIKQKENELVEQSQLLLKKISTDTAWASSVLALTSVGIASEIAPMWSEVNHNLSLESTLLKTSISLKRSAEQLFPLVASEELDLILFGRKYANNLQNITLNQLNNWDNGFQFLRPNYSQVNQQKWLMYPTKSSGSLIAIPTIANQPLLAGFPSFLSSLDFVNSKKYSDFNRLNSFNKNNLLSDSLDPATYNIENKLMATPKTHYKNYLPKLTTLFHK